MRETIPQDISPACEADAFPELTAAGQNVQSDLQFISRRMPLRSDVHQDRLLGRAVTHIDGGIPYYARSRAAAGN